jgi:phenylacetate-CoA ligase
VWDKHEFSWNRVIDVPTMDVITPVRRRLFRMGLRMFRPDVLIALDTMVRWESLGAAEVRRLQLAKLNRLLEFHRRRPFYLALCNAISSPTPPLQQLADLALYPIVTKDLIRRHQDEIAKSREAYREVSTSGSSGTNFVFHQSREMARERTACVHRFNQLVGYDSWGEPSVMVWGHSPHSSFTKEIVDNLKRAALNVTLLPSYGMDEAIALRYARRIRRLRPRAIDGYPSYLQRIAHVALNKGEPPYRGAVITHSGEQALPHDLEAIREYFGHRVYARYGSREFGAIAHELPGEVGYRVSPNRFLLENDPDGGLLVTDLDNLATPFIRYEIGDAATVIDEESVDAAAAQRIAELQGRVHDRLETSDGRLMPGQFWTLLTRSVPGIEAFQVVQKAPDYVELRIQVDAARFGDMERARLVREAEKVLSSSTTVSVVQVPEIERTRLGKRRFVIREF